MDRVKLIQALGQLEGVDKKLIKRCKRIVDQLPSEIVDVYDVELEAEDDKISLFWGDSILEKEPASVWDVGYLGELRIPKNEDMVLSIDFLDTYNGRKGVLEYVCHADSIDAKYLYQLNERTLDRVGDLLPKTKLHGRGEIKDIIFKLVLGDISRLLGLRVLRLAIEVSEIINSGVSSTHYYGSGYVKDCTSATLDWKLGEDRVTVDVGLKGSLNVAITKDGNMSVTNVTASVLLEVLEETFSN